MKSHSLKSGGRIYKTVFAVFVYNGIKEAAFNKSK